MLKYFLIDFFKPNEACANISGPLAVCVGVDRSGRTETDVTTSIFSVLGVMSARADKSQPVLKAPA